MLRTKNMHLEGTVKFGYLPAVHVVRERLVVEPQHVHARDPTRGGLALASRHVAPSRDVFVPRPVSPVPVSTSFDETGAPSSMIFAALDS